MNSIRQTQALNKRELEAAVPPSASWHADYRDTAYIYVGGFPFDLSEGDILTIFSQYGNPTHLNLIRDRETGKSKGFAFLKYEDQRSCDLAVDNLGGATVLGRVLRVDHTRYKKKEGEDEETWRVERLEGGGKNGELATGNWKRETGDEETEGDDNGGGRKKRRRTTMIREEKELEELMRVKDGEEEDPMRQYLIQEKKEEVQKALAKIRRKERHRHKPHQDKEKDVELNREHRSHRHRGDVENRHHTHHHHHRRHGERDSRRRRKNSDDEETHSHHGNRRYVSDDEPSSRSPSPRRGRRDGERTVSRSKKWQVSERKHISSTRRRDVEDDGAPLR